MRLFDTARGDVVPFEPSIPGQVSMYVCGPTVYGPAHLGHGRFSLVFDILRRYLEWTGLEVRYVSNVTDVDDNIIAQAERDETTESEVADKWEARWWASMERIGVKAPTLSPHATEFIPQMIEVIDRLVEADAAYVTSDGVYFAPETVEDYGLLARQSIESLQAGARIAVDSEKKSPIDFALWKFVDAESGLSWDAPWGRGRPGWHTECVAMALELLGDGFDLHGGGQDLAFPHHENERAQALACGHVFARHWLHNGFVEVDGEKMSKSLGNFTDLDDLAARVDPRSYRLLVLRSHYRTPVEITEATTGEAATSLARLDGLLRRCGSLDGVTPDPVLLERFVECMERDMDTPGVVEAIFTAARRANTALDADEPDTARPLVAAIVTMADAVGLSLGGADPDEVPSEVQALCLERDEARTTKDWAEADRLRDLLGADGWVVEDTNEGTKVRRSV